MFTKAGDQVPVIPFKEVVGKTGGVAPTHKEAIVLKVGNVGAFTVRLNVVVLAQIPLVGVKVYTKLPATAVLTAGLQVPVIPLIDVVGKTGGVAPLQTDVNGEKLGTIGVLTVKDKVVVAAHCPMVGVNVYIVVPVVDVLTAGLQVPVKPLSEVVGKTGGVSP